MPGKKITETEVENSLTNAKMNQASLGTISKFASLLKELQRTAEDLDSGNLAGRESQPRITNIKRESEETPPLAAARG